MGGILAKTEVADCFQPGDHASTFGGTPFVSGIALASCGVIMEDKFLANLQENGDYLQAQLQAIGERHPGVIAEVRGMGLMIGVELTGSAPEAKAKLQEKGVLINSIGDHVLRMVPPLILGKAEIDELIPVLEEVLIG